LVTFQGKLDHTGRSLPFVVALHNEMVRLSPCVKRSEIHRSAENPE
jgi:hypothetical protein